MHAPLASPTKPPTAASRSLTPSLPLPLQPLSKEEQTGYVERQAKQGEETATGMQKETFGEGSAAQSAAGKKGGERAKGESHWWARPCGPCLHWGACMGSGCNVTHRAAPWGGLPGHLTWVCPTVQGHH